MRLLRALFAVAVIFELARLVGVRRRGVGVGGEHGRRGERQLLGWARSTTVDDLSTRTCVGHGYLLLPLLLLLLPPPPPPLLLLLLLLLWPLLLLLLLRRLLALLICERVVCLPARAV